MAPSLDTGNTDHLRLCSRVEIYHLYLFLDRLMASAVEEVRWNPSILTSSLGFVSTTHITAEDLGGFFERLKQVRPRRVMLQEHHFARSEENKQSLQSISCQVLQSNTLDYCLIF